MRSAAPFVGRWQELGWLERRLREAIEGAPATVLVGGEAGMGKTRLLQEIRAVAAREGAQVHFGRCFERVSLPYLPFVEALSDHVRAAAQAGVEALPGARTLTRFFDRTAAAVREVSANEDAEKISLFLAVSGVLLALARSRPTILLLDDLHWADYASLDLLSHLVFAVSDAAARDPVRLLIVCGHRPMKPDEPAALVLARLQREAICKSLELPGFNEAEVRELVQALGIERPSRQLVFTISKATRGNPLFIEEVVRHLESQGALRERGGYVVTTAAPSDLRLPDELTRAIAARATGIGERSRELLVLASFLGDRFPLPTLAAAADVPEDELFAPLEDAMRERLVVSEGETFEFAHPLVREVFYNEPSAARRHHIHLRIARALERLYAEDREGHVLEIAHHMIGAGPAADPYELVDYARRAGDQAFELFAWDEAAHDFETALKAAQSTPRVSAEERAELHYRAATAHHRHGDLGPCVDHYDRALEGFRSVGDPEGEARTIIGRTRAQMTLAAVPYGMRLDVRPLEEALAREPAPVLRGQILAAISQSHWIARDAARAEATARQALEIGETIADDRLCAEASHACALAAIQTMRVREALEAWERSLLHARRTADPWLEGLALPRIPLSLALLGRLDEAETLAREACERTAARHHWSWCSVALSALASIRVARGDFEGGERHAQEAMAMVRRSRYAWGGLITLPALACARSLRGRSQEAEDAIGLLVEPGNLFEEVGLSTQLIAWWYRQLSRAHSAAPNRVRNELASLPPLGREAARPELFSLPAFCALVEMGDLLGTPTQVEIAEEALAAAAERGVVLSAGWGGWVFAIARVLGIAASQLRRWDRAEARFREAIAQTSACGARAELGRSYLDYARMLLSRGGAGDRDRAAESLRSAAPIFDELGMEPFSRRAAEIADGLGLRLGEGRQPQRSALSPQERSVLVEVARGRSDEEIAAARVLSPETVAGQVEEVFKKIGVAGRAGAAVYARRKGIVPGPHPIVILFTDLEASTEFMNRVGDVKGREILRQHDSLVRACLRRHRGTEIKHTGDGFMVSFSSASAAVKSAIEIQRNLAQYREKHSDRPIRVRIGINAGEPIAEEGQLFGAAVNAAARLCARARPDQILVSEALRDLAPGKTIEFVDRGRVPLRGFSKRFHVFEVPWEAAAARAEH